MFILAVFTRQKVNKLTIRRLQHIARKNLQKKPKFYVFFVNFVNEKKLQLFPFASKFKTIYYCLTLKLLKNVKFLYFPVPPDEVTILGPSEVKTDMTYIYRCEAKNANPAPKIQWIVNGIVTTTGVSTQTHPPPPRPSGFVPYNHPTG